MVRPQDEGSDPRMQDALALAEAIAGSEQRFVPLMNEKALSLGAKDTKFINATGLPGPGQYTTALDLSKILNHALRFSKLREIIRTPKARITTEKGKVFHLSSTDKLLRSDEKVLGGKTGYTRRAGHCFVGAAQDETRTILVAILGSRNRKSLWMETEKLFSTNYEGGSPVKLSPLDYSLRRLLYEDSSFYFLFSLSPGQSPPYQLWPPSYQPPS